MTSGEYLQRGVRQRLRVVHKAQRKRSPNRLGPGEEKHEKILPSISLLFFEKFFPVSVETHLVIHTDTQTQN
jgi:hypothetical protein